MVGFGFGRDIFSNLPIGEHNRQAIIDSGLIELLGVLMALSKSSMVAGRKALSVAARVNTGCRSAVVHQEQSENHTQNRLKSSPNNLIYAMHFYSMSGD